MFGVMELVEFLFIEFLRVIKYGASRISFYEYLSVITNGAGHIFSYEYLQVLKNGAGRIYTYDFIINVYYGPTTLCPK